MKKRLPLILLIGVGLVVIAAVAAFMFLGTIVKAGVEKGGPYITKVPVNLGAAVISVFSGSGELKGFVMGNPEQFKSSNSVSVGSVALKLEPSSVLGKKIIVRSIRVESPEITYEAAFGGSNIGKILENIQAVAASGKTDPNQPGSQKGLQVDEFVITGAKLNVTASVLGGATATLPLPEIRLANLGQGPEGITAAELSAKAFGEIVEASAKAVAANAMKLGGNATDAAKNLGTDLQDRAKKTTSGLTDLLKKSSK
ncbi:MAG TPA: hypothetical protein VF773_12135 [Verrucomicrobiae bacterium]